MHGIDKRTFRLGLMAALLHSFFYLFVILSSLWLCLAIWVHQPFGQWITLLAIGCWIILSCSLTGIYISQSIIQRKTDVWIYLCCFAIALCCYFAMPARNDRDWNPEVARILAYQRDGDLVQIENVRNFDWHSENQYTQRWETRHYDLRKVQSMDLILSYWAGKEIAHTLLSFNFSDGQHLVFSIEIRKEKTEEFSTIGGFFRKYELAIIAADEKDILYTRSNIRKEHLYIYPVRMSKQHMQELFLSYLQQAQALQTTPRWYNTLFSNCTTIIFDMVNNIEPLPVDYRIILSGLLPAYLYDHQILSHQYSLTQWTEMAAINPRVAHFQQRPDQSSLAYSKAIRSGLPVAQP